MTDFDFDCMQKKRLAHQAFHRKRGSKSRRCSLSTDHMTQGQWKERNGKIVTVNLNRPTTWDNFKALSKESQEEYLRYLSDFYGANSTNLSEMFDMSVNTVRRYIQSADLNIRFPVGRSMSAGQRAAWERFLHSETQTDDGPDTQTPCQAQEEAPAESVCEPMLMKEVSLCFTGPIDIEMISNSLRSILGGGCRGEVRITCGLL